MKLSCILSFSKMYNWQRPLLDWAIACPKSWNFKRQKQLEVSDTKIFRSCVQSGINDYNCNIEQINQWTEQMKKNDFECLYFESFRDAYKKLKKLNKLRTKTFNFSTIEDILLRNNLMVFKTLVQGQIMCTNVFTIYYALFLIDLKIC